MRTFFTQMLSGERGVSSKRSVLFWCMVLETINFMTNLFTGKAMSETYSDHLHVLTLAAMGIVFGEPAMKAIGAAKGGSKTKTTVVAPGESTVINTETKDN
jgi:hypothetical protein